jgi:ferredoxin
MGTTIDVTDRLFKPSNRLQLPKLKYYILAVLGISALFSMQAVYLLDPLSLLTRTIVLAVYAPIQMALLSLLKVLDAVPSAYWLTDKLYMLTPAHTDQAYFREALPVFLIFAAIVGMGALSRRFWCRNLCPLGALLGLFARVPVLKLAVSDGCTGCKKCSRECKMGAIAENLERVSTSECIECFDCVTACPKKTFAFGFGAPKKPVPLDISRRRLVMAAGLGVGVAAMAKIDPGRKRAQQAPTTKISSPDLLRPPGAVTEDAFVNKCTRCGECMKVCPTSGLQPAVHEAGIEGFWTPVLVPKIGCCIQNCNGCGQVCPTEAIKPFTIEEKSHLIVGKAGVDKSKCLAWNSGRKCMVCAEYCPYAAVNFDRAGDVDRPVVNYRKCTGCGACEHACPVQPAAAIRVRAVGTDRTS